MILHNQKCLDRNRLTEALFAILRKIWLATTQ